MSNLPPGLSNGGYRTTYLELVCPNGHTFEKPGFFELGGYFLCDEDDILCPDCGEEGE